MPIERPTRIIFWAFDVTLAHRAGMGSSALVASIAHREYGEALADNAAKAGASEQDFAQAWFAFGDARATGVFSSTEDSVGHVGQLMHRARRARARAASS